MIYKLSPSDLTYLFEGCKYCFNLKAKYQISQPSKPIPGIFSAIAGKQKIFYSGMRTEKFCKELPPGIVEYGEKWVQSTPINFNNSPSSCYIAGRFDLVIKFDDGSFGVIDCKTASPSETKTQMFRRQLQCYVYALENPVPGKLALFPISKLGLLYFEPFGLEQIQEGQQIFKGNLVWHEVKRDDRAFLDFMGNVIGILDSEEVYPHTCERCDYCNSGNSCLAGKPDAFTKGCTCCPWCTYRATMRDIDKGSSAPLAGLKIQDSPLCPICNSQMQKRSGKFGEFWSCQRFPDCRGTRDVRG
ncbi:MAG: hypothetical protein A3K83_03270 [Omnitrophica WOR_2 bacterium RBG_13_44_8b]|nr:MAG: hypothetical protein A3K83_03270 [Omnitrophica WOR_2 bacterium RBG_13_44_8b]